MTDITHRRLLPLVVLLAVTPALTGCIQGRVKALEIRQLNAEIAGIRDARAFLDTSPQLGSAYDAHLFVGGGLFNRFLDGLNNYEIPLDKPKGAVMTIERTQLEFKDGAPTAFIIAKARDRKNRIEVRLRLRADLNMVADPEKGEVNITFAVREIVPEVRLSIFRLRQLFFVAGLLRLEADKYSSSLPASAIPIAGTLPIVMDPAETGEIAMGKTGVLFVRQKLPHFSLLYRYRASRALTLADGVHVLFKLERVQ